MGCCSFPISILIIGKTDAHYTMPIRLIIYGLFAFSELAFVAIAYWVVLDSGIVYSAVERSAVKVLTINLFSYEALLLFAIT